MLTVIFALVALGLVFLGAEVLGKLPPWPAVLVLYVVELLRTLPLGR